MAARNKTAESVSFPTQMRNRLEAAQGKRECDLMLKNARYLDVFSCQWRTGNLALQDGVIVDVDRDKPARQTLDASQFHIVPGFIDAHVHVESSMMLPAYFQNAVLPLGTTSAICDPHELSNVVGPSGLEYFLESSSRLDIDLWVMMSSCVPATHLETNGGGEIPAEVLSRLKAHPKALGLAEMMNVPGVLNGDPGIVSKLEAFQDVPIDGHCPGLSGDALSAYASAGITSCHESTQLGEAEEKLRKGISVWIREGSVAKDLEALVPLLNLATSTSIGFCTDDRNPLDISDEGHIDHLIRGAVTKGVDPTVAYRTASWSVARHYGLNLGWNRVGAVAPGYAADLVILNDEKSCDIHSVLKQGRWAHELETPKSVPANISNTVRANVPEEAELEGPSGRIHCIGVLEGKIVTTHEVLDSNESGVARLSVLERYGNSTPPSNAYVKGFGVKLNGAIASSVGHDSHNLIVVGSDTKDMKVALQALIESGGGFAVVKNANVISHLALPFGGLMSEKTPDELKDALVDLKGASRSIGCELNEPFLQLAFLSLPVIPSLKLTDQGLVDVERFEFISVSA